MSVHLLVGLGNPGPKYARNRHNVGFMVVDLLAERWRAGGFREKFDGSFTKVNVGDEEMVLLKPQTFMNLSGRSVQPAARFFRVPVERLLCIHDELDLPFGTIRLKQGGGVAGHKGLRSIVERMGSEGFGRCRIGIGRPEHGRVEPYVLSDFNALERGSIEEVLGRAADAVETVIRRGMTEAMNRHNARANTPAGTGPEIS